MKPISFLKPFFIILLCMLMLSPVFVNAQTVNKQATDTFKIFSYNADGGNLIIENKTSRARPGSFLRNTTNGRTEFAYALDSAWKTGDTLYLKRGDGYKAFYIPGPGAITLTSSRFGDSITITVNGVSTKFGMANKLNKSDTVGMLTPYKKAFTGVAYDDSAHRLQLIRFNGQDTTFPIEGRNFVNADLVATEDRQHSFGGNNLRLDSIGSFYVSADSVFITASGDGDIETITDTTNFKPIVRNSEGFIKTTTWGAVTEGDIVQMNVLTNTDTTTHTIVLNYRNGQTLTSSWPERGGGGSGGTADGNNFPSGLTYSSDNLSLARSGLSTLSVTIPTSTKINISDSAGMLAPYLRRYDTTAMLSPYLRRYDTTAMLSPYVHSAGWGLIKSGKALRVDSTLVTSSPEHRRLADSLLQLIIATGGTVTSVATNNGTGITGGTITSTGTLAIDTTSTISTKANVTKLVNASSFWAASGSNIYNTNAANVGIGTSAPIGKLHVVGSTNSNTTDADNIISGLANNLTQGFAIRFDGLYAIGSTSNVNVNIKPKGSGYTNVIGSLYTSGASFLNGLRLDGSDVSNTIYQEANIGITNNGGANGLHIYQSGGGSFQGGVFNITNLAGTGSRMVIANGAGDLSTQEATTDNITEGSTNKYYTDARARAALSVTGDLTYNSSTGVIGHVGNIDSVVRFIHPANSGLTVLDDSTIIYTGNNRFAVSTPIIRPYTEAVAATSPNTVRQASGWIPYVPEFAPKNELMWQNNFFLSANNSVGASMSIAHTYTDSVRGISGLRLTSFSKQTEVMQYPLHYYRTVTASPYVAGVDSSGKFTAGIFTSMPNGVYLQAEPYRGLRISRDSGIISAYGYTITDSTKTFNLKSPNGTMHSIGVNNTPAITLDGSAIGGGSGSGTVNSGTQYRIPYYATTGTTLSEAAAITSARALISDGNGLPTHSATTATELGYVSGVTSAIQTQLNAKASLSGLTSSYLPYYNGTSLANSRFIYDGTNTSLTNHFSIGAIGTAVLTNAEFSIHTNSDKNFIMVGTNGSPELSSINDAYNAYTELRINGAPLLLNNASGGRIVANGATDDGSTPTQLGTGNIKFGTVTSGTWNGTAVGVVYGGTGRSTSTTAYGLIAAGTTATGAQQTLAAGATTEILVGGGSSALPVWTTATGTGAPVRATSPDFTTPTISSAAIPSISSTHTLTNKTLTNPAFTSQALTDGATITWNSTNGTIATVTLAGNRTLAITNAVANTYYQLTITQDGTGSRTITLPSGSKVISGGAGAVTLSTTAGAKDILTAFYDGTNYYWNIGKNYN